MIVKGKIKEVNESGTATIEAPIDINKMIHQNIKNCYVEFIDSRSLSNEQRRMCYALINAISEWSGSEPEDIKESFKQEFWADRIDTMADKIFSLSNAPMSLVAEFQKFLIKFIIDNDVPVKRPLREYVDDVEHYTYMCVIHKKCCVCGKKADLHHIDTIGMGNNRNEVVQEGREAISLCREHHSEIHTIGKEEFMEKYHLNGGINIDRTIMKIYNLRGKKNENEL